MWSSIDLARSLLRSSIAFTWDHECPILLDVDQIDLHVLTIDIHDGEGLLPVGRSLCVACLAKIHKIAYFYTMQDTPYTASWGLCEGRTPCPMGMPWDNALAVSTGCLKGWETPLWLDRGMISMNCNPARRDVIWLLMKGDPKLIESHKLLEA